MTPSAKNIEKGEGKALLYLAEMLKQFLNSYESNDRILLDILYLTFPFLFMDVVDQLATLEIPVSVVGISY